MELTVVDHQLFIVLIIMIIVVKGEGASYLQLNDIVNNVSIVRYKVMIGKFFVTLLA